MEEAPPVASRDVSEILDSIERIEFDRYRIVGEYLRYEEPVRVSLGELRQQVTEALSSGGMPSAFLLWGAPGSGKTYLVEQIGASLPERGRVEVLNLTQLDEEAFHRRLDEVVASGRPSLCLIDEIDARPDEAWPYEALLTRLEPARPPAAPTCFVLAGSGGANLAEMKRAIAARPKGIDLLSRIPGRHEYVVPRLTPADRMVVSAIQAAGAASEQGKPIRHIEKLALYWLATSPGPSSARQLRSIAVDAARRIAIGEDRIRYDDLFRSGDPENKAFWAEASPRIGRLANKFVRVDVVGASPSSPRGPPPIRRTAAPASSRPDGSPKIAVLPFTNLSPSPDDAYFADAMTEELIGHISRVGRIRVIARTSAMHYKGSGMRVRDIAGELDVSALVEGSIRRSGDRIRLTAQLIDAVSEEPVWTTQLDRDLNDLFAVQSEVASKVAESIAHAVAPEPVRDGATNASAYTTNLRARQLLHADTEETIREAIPLFEEAIRNDPRLAVAYSGLARCWTNLVARGQETWETLSTKAEPSARRGIEVGPELAEPHAALAQILSLLDRFSEAIRESEIATSLDPSHATAYLALGTALAALGRLPESLVALRHGHELDPLDALTAVTLAGVANVAGATEEGDAVFERIHGLYPQNPPLLRSFAIYWAERGNLERAQSLLADALQRTSEDLTLVSGVGIVAAIRGDRATAESVLARGRDSGSKGWSPDTELEVRLALGDVDEAFRILERDGALHTWPWLVLSDPKYRPLREHPGFRAFCESVGIPAP